MPSSLTQGDRQRTATLDYSQLTPGDELLNATQLEVRVAMRRRVGAGEPLHNATPLHFNYVGSKWFDNYRRASTSPRSRAATPRPIFNASRLHSSRSLCPGGGSFLSNLYIPVTVAAIAVHAKPDAINVFMIEGITIPVDLQTERSALGFACEPGPQGFLGPQACVVIRALPPDSGAPDMGVSRTITHEIEHYLGLMHESACATQGCTLDQCLNAQRTTNPSPPRTRGASNRWRRSTRPLSLHFAISTRTFALS